MLGLVCTTIDSVWSIPPFTLFCQKISGFGFGILKIWGLFPDKTLVYFWQKRSKIWINILSLFEARYLTLLKQAPCLQNIKRYNLTRDYLFNQKIAQKSCGMNRYQTSSKWSYDAYFKWHMPIWGEICRAEQKYIPFFGKKSKTRDFRGGTVTERVFRKLDICFRSARQISPHIGICHLN